MGIVIATINQKGGVGKTTTSINLSAALAALKHKVLLIDLDPQSNATVGSGVSRENIEFTLQNALCLEASIEQTIVATQCGYDLVPTDQDLVIAEMKMLNTEKSEQRLKTILTAVKKNYDYVIIDCPPSLNILTVNALVAATAVLIPVQCEYYALEGLKGLLNTVKQIQKTLNPRLKIEGLVRTMFDSRNRLATDVSAQLKAYFVNQLYDTVIPRNVRVAEAPSHGQSILHYDPKSQGALAYKALAKEMVQREQAAKAFLNSKQSA